MWMEEFMVELYIEVLIMYVCKQDSTEIMAVNLPARMF